jgi:hypothetical protein
MISNSHPESGTLILPYTDEDTGLQRLMLTLVFFGIRPIRFTLLCMSKI